ncbi:Rv3654c family TadE-like protein [Geodermatophilus sp. SYSU D00742]
MIGGSRLTGERGSATVWVVALAGVLAAIGVAAVLVGVAVVGRHRASAAADLAALAAAEQAVRGRADVCGVAARVAEANGARLTGCGVDGAAVVEVAVVVPVRLGRLGMREAAARARAGPVWPVPVGDP